jgi:putative endonuclease
VDRGSWGEKVAERFLCRKHYHVLYKNWRAGHGEIDIVAMDGDVLVFVEVKVRSLADAVGGYGAAVAPAKRRTLATVCRTFLSNFEGKFPHFRFDVVEILTPRRTYRAESIFHFENVPLFTASEAGRGNFCEQSFLQNDSGVHHRCNGREIGTENGAAGLSFWQIARLP